MEELTVTSLTFLEGGMIPVENTARGADRSPELRLHGLNESAVSIAVTMDDASHPLFPNYNHWAIWNLPPRDVIPGAIPRGADVPGLSGAVQGLAYGRHRYKGPKPPRGALHTYVFTVYALDRALDLGPRSRKRSLLRTMEGHILQKAVLTGKFRNPGQS
jgi:Raf kinase inhibitor-like YbhB/YbcL family protein